MEKVSPEISREEKLSDTVRSFPVFLNKSHKEKDAVKNARDGVITVLEFIPTGNYFILTLLFHVLKLSYLFGLTY